MKVVIVGNGIAGITAARTIRETDPNVEIVIVTAEKYHYYPRPWLIDFLAGTTTQESGIFYQPKWYEDRSIEVRLRTLVTGIDVDGKSIAISDGTRIGYDTLLLANGSRPNVPPVPGVDLRGVFTLRTLDDALRIKEYARSDMNAVVVGGGLLGLESARALKGLGLRPSVLQMGDRLLPAQLDQRGADLLKERIEDAGISVILNASTQAFQGNENIGSVALEDGRSIPADMVLISAGIKSNLELGKSSGLATGRGVIVSDTLSTSAPHVYAAGDVAEYAGRVYGIVPAAVEQGKAAALAILGRGNANYAGTTPSNTLQVVGIDLTSVGIVNPSGQEYEVYLYEDPGAGVYKKLVAQNGKAVGAIILGDRRSVPAVSRIVKEHIDLGDAGPRVLTPGFDAKSLINR